MCPDINTEDDNNTVITPPKSKGWLTPTITHEVEKDTLDSATNTVKEISDNVTSTVTNIGKDLSKGIAEGLTKAGESIGEGLSSGLTGAGTAAAAAYLLKNSSLPPAAKAGLVVASGVGPSLIKKGVSNLGIDTSQISTGHPDSPTESTFIDNISNSSSSLWDFLTLNLDKIFGLDPDNRVLNLIFSILGLGFCNLFLIYFICLMLFYLYLFNKYNNNLELPWLNKYFSEKTSTRIKFLISKSLKYSVKSNKIALIYALILLIIFSIFSTYFLFYLYVDFDKYIEVYIKYKNLKII
jgi:hypothetical protein